MTSPIPNELGNNLLISGPNQGIGPNRAIGLNQDIGPNQVIGANEEEKQYGSSQYDVTDCQVDESNQGPPH
ncbi:hypothetical protein M8J75_015829 [Diaphorina citri]|nr:hypothetical protein M8J75_015829 [Diaphorina citri]